MHRPEQEPGNELPVPSVATNTIKWSLEDILVGKTGTISLHTCTVSPKCLSARGHTNGTKQCFGLTSFPRTSSRVLGVSAGTNDGEAPATLLQFGLPHQCAGVAMSMQSRENHVGSSWVVTDLIW